MALNDRVRLEGFVLGMIVMGVLLYAWAPIVNDCAVESLGFWK